jgi:hypothetical protein
MCRTREPLSKKSIAWLREETGEAVGNNVYKADREVPACGG